MASKKRDIAPDQLEKIVDDVENALRSSNVAEVKARDIGEMAMDRLRPIDEIAFVRFASVYRSFKDVTQMRSEIEEILAHPPGTRPVPQRKPKKKASDGSELALDIDK